MHKYKSYNKRLIHILFFASHIFITLFYEYMMSIFTIYGSLMFDALNWLEDNDLMIKLCII